MYIPQLQNKTKKKQHFVPKFYLKRFANDEDRLFVFDKFQKKSFPSTINNIAEENFFYDLPEDENIKKVGIDPQFIENVLSEYEKKYAPFFLTLIARIENKKIKNLFRPEHKAMMAQFLILQMTRTREYREMQNELAEEVLNSRLKIEMPEYASVYRLKMNPDHVPMNQGLLMFDPEFQNGLAKILYNHIWLVGINETDQPLYTSDHPVQIVPFGKKGGAGLNSPGVKIIFPITPKYLLLIYEKSVHTHLIAKEGQRVVINQNDITAANLFQVSDSYRQVFCSQDSFSLVNKMLQKNPEIFTPDRKRFNTTFESFS